MEPDLVFDFTADDRSADEPQPNDGAGPDYAGMSDEDFDALLGDPDDTTPDGGQIGLIAAGAHLIGKAAGDTGMPRDRTGEDIQGTQIVVNALHLDPDTPPPFPTYTYTLTGKGDKDVTRVTAKYAAKLQDPRLTSNQRLQLFVQSQAEIAKVKQGKPVKPEKPTKAAAATPAPPRSEASQPPKKKVEAPVSPATEKSYQVVIDYGPPYGRQVATYVGVVIHGNILVLIGDPAVAVVNIPEPTDPPAPLLVAVPGIETPIRVYATGQGFPYDDKLFCLFLIDREEAGDSFEDLTSPG